MTGRDDLPGAAVVVLHCHPTGRTILDATHGATLGHLTQATTCILEHVQMIGASHDMADAHAISAWAEESLERYDEMIRRRETDGAAMIRPQAAQ